MTQAPPTRPSTRSSALSNNVWIVDGPVIRFGMPWPKFPFPTRMTVDSADASGDLFVHSPTPLTPSLQAEIEREGRVRFIVGPNRIHYWWIPEWKAAFPRRGGLSRAAHRRAGERTASTSTAVPLAATSGYPWDAEIATLPIVGQLHDRG